MKAKRLDDRNGEATYAVVFDPGDEFIGGLTDFAKRQRLNASHFTAIGAFSDATLGYFDMEKEDYLKIPIGEQVEVLSLVGDVALDKGEPKVHAHVVVGRADGTTRGGHILDAHVRPTLEVILVESPAHLRRMTDEATGLALIAL
jgi:predicted DNA-binding protein with PD1-like motif